ncbi:DUF1254 domain-containing protein [Flavobacterium sp. JAS]|uniref:DUF1254 domain-containing protein n=1 Tax=Flavobacterium sp. JAS TaxID=2897329 RepID=UPI00351D25FE
MGLFCLGRRTTGTKPGKFAIVPPGWKGAIPKGVTKVIITTTPKVWLWGRDTCSRRRFLYDFKILPAYA